METIKKYLQNCTTELDTYKMDECISKLFDDMHTVSFEIDHINDVIHHDGLVWISEKEYTLSEKEIDFIYKHLIQETAELRVDWQKNKDDQYDDFYDLNY